MFQLMSYQGLGGKLRGLMYDVVQLSVPIDVESYQDLGGNL